MSRLLLAYEESGYVSEGVAENERLSNPIANWTIAKAQRAGADAIKLLAYYHPDASPETLKHQQAFVRHVGDECEKQDLPFLLELVSYALEGTTKSVAFAKQKPRSRYSERRRVHRSKLQGRYLEVRVPCRS